MIEYLVLSVPHVCERCPPHVRWLICFYSDTSTLTRHPQRGTGADVSAEVILWSRVRRKVYSAFVRVRYLKSCDYPPESPAVKRLILTSRCCLSFMVKNVQV